MESSREVVTLQLGHYANFVGAHWWNLQESAFVYTANELKEIEHDILWRVGHNLNGDETYTPRLIAFDLKESLNTLRQGGTLYDVADAAENIAWDHDVTLHKTDSASKNQFLQDLEAADKNSDEVHTETDKEECVAKIIEMPEEPIFRGAKIYNLDASVKVWSDYLRVHLHPRSTHLVQQYNHGDSDTCPFNVFGYGQTVYKDYDTRNEIEDRLHFFLEECNGLKGLHILIDSYDGFGGLGSSILEDLSDDYGSKSMLSIPVTPLTFQNDLIRDKCHRAVNTLLTMDALLSHSSSILPLSLQHPSQCQTTLPYLSFKPDLPYHTSSILAAALDCATMPYRVESSPVAMADMLGALCQDGRKILGLQASFPFPSHPGSSLVSSLLDLGGNPAWFPLTSGYKSGSGVGEGITTPWAQSVHLRGFSKSRLHPAKPSGIERLQQCTTVPEVLNLYLEDVTGSKRNNISTLESPLNLQSPFPQIFNRRVSSQGEVLTKGVKDRAPGLGVTSAPVMTSLQATPDMQYHLRGMLDAVKKFNIKKFHKFLDAGLDEDEYKEVLSRLESVHDLYTEK